MKYPGVDYSGHHHHETYDWRKDPKVNKDIEENVMGNLYLLFDIHLPRTWTNSPPAILLSL